MMMIEDGSDLNGLSGDFCCAEVGRTDRRTGGGLECQRRAEMLQKRVRQ